MINSPLTLLNLDEVAPKPKSGKAPLKTKTKTSAKIAASVAAAKQAILEDGGLPENYVVVKELSDLGRIAREISKAKAFSFDTEGSGLDPWRDHIYCISLWVKDTGYLINFEHPLLPQIGKDNFVTQLGEFFNRPDIKRKGFNTKYDGHMIEENMEGILIPGFAWDGYVGSWLINTGEPLGQRSLKPLCEKYLNFNAGGKYNEQFGKQAWITIDPLVASYYAIKDAWMHDELCKWQEKTLKKQPRVLFLMDNMDMPVHNKLYEVEREGIDIDLEFLQQKAPELAARIEDIRNKMDALAIGAGFTPPNWGSDDELPVFLFDTLKLTRIKGNSTDKEVLDALEGEHELIPLIRDWRALTKVQSGFMEPLQSLIAPDGKLHPIFKGIGSDTTRMTCENPNLFQMPGRGEGAFIRNAFPAGDGYFLVSMDFSGQELRIQACQDRELEKIILEDRDYYSEVTAIAFGGTGADYPKHGGDPVKMDLRNKRGKPAVLALGFGAQAAKLASIFKWVKPKAQKFIDDYFRRFWGLKQFNDEQIKLSKKNGFVETILGHRKHLDYNRNPDTLPVPLHVHVAGLERQAQNAPIQGSAADQTKAAYLLTDRHLKDRYPRSKVLFPIHDELIFRIHREDLLTTTILQELDHIMINAIPFRVPHKTSTEIYERWGTAINPFGKLSDEEMFWLRENQTAS